MVTKAITVMNSHETSNQKLVNDVWGPNADHNIIKKILDQLKVETVQIASTVVKEMKADRVASTSVGRKLGNTKPIKLGEVFFKESPLGPDATLDFRAGALIHEATHYLAKTGDLMNIYNHVIRAGENQKKDVSLKLDGKPRTGCEYGFSNQKLDLQ
ncbi:hypothetical protein CPB83DRAFT_303695 [Crepidotus variabilis]|uniref:Uncharacterized protein n=1 Tax=Crepidotus variabilis TaxID=179855 RepID=A0A9P6EGQ8_9AGAR|nr:hypothetical protein CPB83DRAFT_303695 [Crepidotus variabilis]